jgi:NAD(P)-dependent dehydrogenase (short-subunit alcohol dehydrogenase family)
MKNYVSPFGSAAYHAASEIDHLLDQQFADKVAVVTGSTQGLGLTTVELMLRRGLKGAVICGRNAEAGMAAAARMSTEQQRVIFQQIDLANVVDCHSLIACTIEEFGSFEILVNSAGVTSRGGILDGDEALWDQTFAINARAPFF